MHPSIAQLVRGTLYKTLRDFSSVSNYPEVAGMANRLFWLDHQNHEAHRGPETHNTSHTNNYEIGMTCAVVSYLVKQGKYENDQIAVLTPYLGNMRKLRDKLSTTHQVVLGERDVADLEAEGVDPPGNAVDHTPSNGLINQKTSLAKAVRLATIDNFQGEEAEVVILSLVRSNPERKVGFLKSTNRINVLLSRAKHGMYIIGDATTAESVGMWHQVIGMLRAQQLLGPTLALQCPRHPETRVEVATPDDFSKHAPEGGCNLPCPDRLTCGHKCNYSCHSELMHRNVVCLERCVRTIEGCTREHDCPRPCGKACPHRCKAIVQVSSQSP